MRTIARLSRRDKVRRGFLDIVYPTPPNIIPDEHYFHEDIPGMSLAQLRREQARAQQRLLHDERPHHWLLERIDRLTEALEHAHAE